MNTKTLMMLAGGGLILYFLSSKPVPVVSTGSGAGTGAGSGSGSGTGTGTATGGGTATSTTSTSTSAAPAFNSLSAIYNRLVAAVTAIGVNPAMGMGPDAWNYYLTQPTVSAIGSAPDPMVVFPGIDRSKNMSAVAYWSGMSDYLSKNAGMSGLPGMMTSPRSRYFLYGGWQA